MNKPDLILVGLGNPGPKYVNTRHNVGFLALDLIAKESSGPNFDRLPSGEAEYSLLEIEEQKVLLVKPLTYMNQSGLALGALLRYFKLNQVEALIPIVVIHDDADLPEGEIRIKETGGDGGHKGMASIIALLETQNILRIKLGIRHPENQKKSINFVLSPFGEKSPIAKAIAQMPTLVTDLIKKGPAWCQSHYHSLLTVHEPRKTPRQNLKETNPNQG